MINQKTKIGVGYKIEKHNIFGASVQYHSVGQWVNKATGQIAIALHRNGVIDQSEAVYRFKSQDKYLEWKERIHNEDNDYLHYGDCSLAGRAYPSLIPSYQTS